jgi:hypothetical protein
MEKSKEVIAFMNNTYFCNFCGMEQKGHLIAEGPGNIHICLGCAASACLPTEVQKKGGSEKGSKEV